MRILCLIGCFLAPLTLAADSDSSTPLPAPAQGVDDDRYILTFFGGRRVPHHRLSHHGHHWHHGHPHGPSAERLTDASQDVVTISPPHGHRAHGQRRALLGSFSFSVLLRDGRRLDGVGGSQRTEPLGRLNEYVIRLPNTSLDDVTSVIISYTTNSTRKHRLVKMSKVWITRFGADLKRAQFNVPDRAQTDMLAPDTEFLMYRACKMLNREADQELIRMYKGSGYLCEDVTIENVVQEDWQKQQDSAKPVTDSFPETTTLPA